MSFWNWVTRKRDDRGWPEYMINGRIRTSTVVMIVAFIVISWVHNSYQPPPPTPATPETAQVVPPGFMPDPDYTWVPRTKVQERPRSTTPTTTTTTESSPTELFPETTSTTTPTSPTAAPSTTVTDPDGPGPLPPTTVTLTASPTTTPLPVPNRSGTPTTVPTTPLVPGQTPAAPAAP